MSATRVRKTADEAPAPLSDNDIYERMVSAILDHQLPPGTKLVEDRLAEAFGVSRTRIRPVLVRLANEQVVTLTPNRGAAIAEPSEAEALRGAPATVFLDVREPDEHAGNSPYDCGIGKIAHNFVVITKLYYFHF